MELIYYENQTMGEVQTIVSKLTTKDILIWLHFTADSAGQIFTFTQSSEMISMASKAPMYSFWDFHLGHGIVGGMLTSGFHQGQTAAKLAVRILQGKDVREIPVIKKSPNRFMFDHNQLKRFSVDEGLIPKNSIIINQQITFYSQNKQLVWFVFICFCGLLIIILKYL